MTQGCKINGRRPIVGLYTKLTIDFLNFFLLP